MDEEDFKAFYWIVSQSLALHIYIWRRRVLPADLLIIFQYIGGICLAITSLKLTPSSFRHFGE